LLGNDPDLESGSSEEENEKKDEKEEESTNFNPENFI